MANEKVSSRGTKTQQGKEQQGPEAQKTADTKRDGKSQGAPSNATDHHSTTESKKQGNKNS